MIHVLCAFYRKHLLETHKKNFATAGIEWVPICDSIDIEPFKDNTIEWIKPFLCEPLDLKKDQVYRKFNDYMTGVQIIDEDYYCFMGDDDGYEPGFFDEIREQTADIVIVSLSRGNNIPPNLPEQGQHPTDPLIVRNYKDIRVGRIGLPQMIIKGKVLNQVRFRNTSHTDDGLLAEHLANHFRHQMVFLPDLFVFGNYYEPHRYTNDHWKLKAHWELPILP